MMATSDADSFGRFARLRASAAEIGNASPMAATIGQHMRLLCRVYRLKIAKRKALLQDRNNVASNRIAVL